MKHNERLEIGGVFYEKGEYYYEFEECGISYSKEEILKLNGCYYYIEEIVNEELEESDLKFDEVVEVISIRDNHINRQGDYDVNYKVKLMIKEIVEEKEEEFDLDEIVNKIKMLNEKDKELNKSIQLDCDELGIKNIFDTEED